MIYALLKPYINQIHIANLFHYITFRSIVGLLSSFISTIIIGKRLIIFLKKWNEQGQPIRELGPETHRSKAGTPTMGGIMIIIPSVIVTLLFCDLENIYVWLFIVVFLSFATLGFYDDYLKVIKKNHYGISAKKKLLIQLLITIPVCIIILKFAPHAHATDLSFPYFKSIFLNLGYFYIPFTVFVVIGASNAVNLTDGLDGLAIVPISISFTCFALISYLVGNVVYANYLQIIYSPGVAELTVICSSIIGASLGFLWYNAQPAEIFMGDTGSLALGGALGLLSVITKQELLLAIIGGLFVIETFSVIIQVYYFKATGGKRFFKMAPIHHHFEKRGWSESKVVVRFWIIAIIFAVIGLASLKLR